MDTFSFDRMTAGGFFKVAFFGLLGIMLPFGLVCGVLALLGSNTVTINGSHVHGIGGLIGGITIGVAIPVVFAGLATLGGLIARIFSRMLPVIRLRRGAQD